MLMKVDECGLIVTDSAAVAVVSKKFDFEMTLIAAAGLSHTVKCCCWSPFFITPP